MAGLRGGGEPGPGEQGQDDARQGHQVGGDICITSEGNIFIELEQKTLKLYEKVESK